MVKPEIDLSSSFKVDCSSLRLTASADRHVAQKAPRKDGGQILIITGATGVGKTDLVLKLAELIPSEIINADIGQMYAPLTIGTAKPDWQKEPVPHHGFDILTQPENFTVVQYRVFVQEKINEIWARGKLPIIVGGSTFYIKALLFPPSILPVGTSDKQAERAQVVADLPEDQLWAKLNQIDPLRASRLHPNDTYRLNQALNIWQQTGQLPSTFTPLYHPIAPYTLVILDRPKLDLYQRIDARVLEMLQMGWAAEVQNLNQAWHDFLKVKKIIGYELILDYLAGEIDLPTCTSAIQQRVRNYAKRQQTFWRGLQSALQGADAGKHVLELDLTLLSLDLYINQLLKMLDR